MSEILVFIFASLLLIGSISIAMPSKASREISKLRMSAKLLGCNITSTLYSKNSFKNDQSISVSYQIKNVSNIKEGHFIRDKNEFILYSPVKLKYENGFESMINAINDISPNLMEIIFTNSSVTFLWQEKEGISVLENIIKKVNYL